MQIGGKDTWTEWYYENKIKISFIAYLSGVSDIKNGQIYVDSGCSDDTINFIDGLNEYIIKDSENTYKCHYREIERIV